MTSFRDWINWQEEKGLLKRVKKEVDGLYEMPALITQAMKIKGPTLLFENVKGSKIPAIGNAYYPLEKQFKWLGTDLRGCAEWWLKKEEDVINGKAELVETSSAPCQEVVWTGADADVTRLPLGVTNYLDPAPYFGTAMVITVDPDDGRINCGCHREMIKGPQRLVLDWHHGMHPYIMWMKARRKGINLPVAFAFGCEPRVLLSTQVDMPGAFPRNELEMASAALGEPLNIVKCKTCDIPVPADAEIVIEGEILLEPQPGEIGESEGPYGEYQGTYGAVRKKGGWEYHGNPVCRVKAITMRKDAILHHMTMPIECNAISYIPTQGTSLKLARTVAPIPSSVKEVYAPSLRNPSTVIVSLKKNLHSEARNLILGMLSSIINKTVIVVDEDVDPYDLEDVLWAVGCRVQPSDGVIIVPNLQGMKLDPSIPEYTWVDYEGHERSSRFPPGIPYVEGQEGVQDKMGIDATADLKMLLERRIRVYPPEEYSKLAEEKWSEYVK